MGEIHRLLEIAQRRAALLRREQRARRFDGPGRSPVEAARQPGLLGLGVVVLVPVRGHMFEIGGAEAHQDFIAPRPDAMIGGPASIAASLAIDEHILVDVRRIGSPRGNGE